MTPRIKVCCIRSTEEADTAIRHGADCLGLVAEMPSGPGPIRDDEIREIARSVPPGVATFLLTSRTGAAAIVDHVRFCGTNVVQLVDEEVEPSTYRRLRAECPAVKIVQVIHVGGDEAVDRALALEGAVDALLLDSGRPSGEVRELGGTGRTHDWGVSARIAATVAHPVFLAGGLNAGNVREAIRIVRPFGVDLCSGVRTEGALDEAKLRDFVGAAVGAEG